MLIDMTDPHSVLAWLRIWPRRHGAQLASMVQRHPEWRPAVDEALRMAREIKQQQQQQQQQQKGGTHGASGE